MSSQLELTRDAQLPKQQESNWLDAARRARLLSWASLAWMTVEGAVGIVAALVAGSVALPCIIWQSADPARSASTVSTRRTTEEARTVTHG